MGHHSSPVLARVAPLDLTIADCVEGWFDVTAWCPTRHCPGRSLDLAKLSRWNDRKLLDLFREGLVVCTRCEALSDAVSVSSSEMADRVLFWRVGDDAMPTADTLSQTRQSP